MNAATRCIVAENFKKRKKTSDHKIQALYRRRLIYTRERTSVIDLTIIQLGSSKTAIPA